jgi:hypothetical protein
LGTSTGSRSRPKLFQGRERVWVAIQKKYPIANQTRSRPALDNRVEIFWVATRSKILEFLHQAVYPGKFSGSRPEKFSGSRPITGRDRNIFLDRDRSRVGPEYFSGSRPVFRFLGRDRIRSRPTGRWSPTLNNCRLQKLIF